MSMRSFPYTVAALITLTTPWAVSAETDDFDPDSVSEIDAINCRLDAPSYNGFALSVAGDSGIAAKRHWRKIESGNPFLDEYELPAPIPAVDGYQTRRIAFSSSAIIAILDLPEPAELARREQIVNEADPEPLITELTASGHASRAQIEADIPFRKFLGERVLVDTTEPANDQHGFGTHTVISRTISNATSHPGKTFYGCHYRIELLDRDGRPL